MEAEEDLEGSKVLLEGLRKVPLRSIPPRAVQLGRGRLFGGFWS